MKVNEKTEKNINELTERVNSKDLLREVCDEIKLSKKSKFQYIFSSITGVSLSAILVFSNNTVTALNDTANIFNGVAIAFVAMILSSYSIFQALLTDDFIMILIETDNNLLKISNKSFLNLIMLYLIDIISSIVIIIVTKVMPNDWCVSSNLIISNIIAMFLISCYTIYNFLIIIEIKNFAINLYNMFNAYNIVRVLTIIENDSTEDDKDNGKKE